MTDTPTTISPVRAAELADALAYLRRGIVAIRDGTLDGSVGGEDVVWFDEITTLHDFCDLLLDKTFIEATALSRAVGDSLAKRTVKMLRDQAVKRSEEPGGSPDCSRHFEWGIADLLEAQSLALAQQKAECAALQQQVREFACEEHDVTLGVGRGDGQLFVHGNHESIQAVRAIIADRAALLRRIGELECRQPDDSRDVAAEQRWKDTQGDDYGSY